MAYPQKKQNLLDFAKARLNMVNGQLLTNGVTNRSLVGVYLETPRELFVDEMLENLVYMDEDIRIPDTERHVLEPLVEARMLQLALEGACGSALVLGAASLPTIEMIGAFTRHVTVLEPEKKFVASANNRLARPNVTIIETGYREGYPRNAPYDIILATGAVQAIPSLIVPQLAIGGCFVSVLRPNPNACGKVSCVRRLSEDNFETTSSLDASTPYLVGFGFEPSFRF
ncbi:MAG: hypothetical protein EBQ96_09530 [Proteobacteria bacterium]|nr:hypothetical protein [Pseudomonadota bacterium]